MLREGRREELPSWGCLRLQEASSLQGAKGTRRPLTFCPGFGWLFCRKWGDSRSALGEAHNATLGRRAECGSRNRWFSTLLYMSLYVTLFFFRFLIKIIFRFQISDPKYKDPSSGRHENKGVSVNQQRGRGSRKLTLIWNISCKLERKSREITQAQHQTLQACWAEKHQGSSEWHQQDTELQRPTTWSCHHSWRREDHGRATAVSLSRTCLCKNRLAKWHSQGRDQIQGAQGRVPRALCEKLGRHKCSRYINTCMKCNRGMNWNGRDLKIQFHWVFKNWASLSFNTVLYLFSSYTAG